jgi:6-pyruvoyltetrahydropterin/6-carboxytetrahydropterin synthase
MKMTRRVTFSSGHRYWLPNLTADQNQALFGPWASPYNHGHNFVLDVTVAGEIHPEDGMVVNIKRVDDLLKEKVIAQFDQRSINDQITAFSDRAPSLENLLIYIRDQLITDGGYLDVPRFEDHLGESHRVRLTHLRLEEMPRLWADLNVETNCMTLTRTYEFAAAHRLNAPQLSAEENIRLYGKCNHSAGHGHNYVLEVSIEGVPDPVSGMMADLGAVDAAVESLIIDRYDHRNLDVDVPELQGKITTSEVVAQTIFDQLNGHLPAELAKIRLWETARNAFEVTRP